MPMLKKPSYAIIFDLNDVIFRFNPELRDTESPFSIIEDGLSILQECFKQTDHTGKKRHKLFVLSNTQADYYTYLTNDFPEIFACFDGIVTTAHTGLSKPDFRMFEHLLKEHNLDPAKCIFIDDKEVNILASKAAGMISIH